MEQETSAQKSQEVRRLLKDPLIVFWLGTVFGMVVTGLIVGEGMISKSIFKQKRFYMDGKYYHIKEAK